MKSKQNYKYRKDQTVYDCKYDVTLYTFRDGPI